MPGTPASCPQHPWTWPIASDRSPRREGARGAPGSHRTRTHPAALGAPDLAGRRDGCSPPGKLTCRSSCPGGLREGKRPGRKSSFWPCAWCLTVMIKPAAEGGGQPIRGRGVALERGVAGTGPASGGVRGEALPSEALQAPLGRTASLGPTAFFSVREVGGRGGRGRRVLGVLGVGPGSLRGVGRGGCSEPVGKCVYSH